MKNDIDLLIYVVISFQHVGFLHKNINFHQMCKKRMNGKLVN